VSKKLEEVSMGDVNNFMVYFNLAIGVYLTYAAIVGKGKAYENEYPAEVKEGVFKLNRIMYSVVGPVLVISGVLELAKVTFFAWFGIIFVLAAIVVYLVIYYKRFGKAIKASRAKKF
jgi:Ca2+/Na+ antiporter